MKLMSNIVKEKALKDVQKQTLADIASVVSKTAGPYGSSTMILHDEILTEYSKDGHKVLKNIQYHKPLERAVHDELLGITEYVVTQVGDGTTSAVQLSSILFNELLAYMEEHPQYPKHMIIETLDKITSEISNIVRSEGRDIQLEDIYNICMICTNGDTTISKDIMNIYEKIGMDVFIQISTSSTDNTVLKTYDGIFIDKGYPSPAFINTDEGVCRVNHPRIYYFEDNVDTPDMINMFMSIFMHNIYEPYRAGQLENCIPTVILLSSVSNDIKPQLEQMEQLFYSFDQQNATSKKPPMCIITGVNTNDNIQDIVMLCGCKAIKKFINPSVEKEAIERGDAPTKENVFDWYGTADEVIVDTSTAKFVNPQFMFDEDAEVTEDGSRPHSKVFTGLVNHLKAELELAQQDKNDLNLIGNIRRRLNHLEANFVEYFVGGVSASDRDNTKDLVEDAVLNCRSAAVSGVGYGANYEGLMASIAVANGEHDTELHKDISMIIMGCYCELCRKLYETAFITDEAEKLLEESIDGNKGPINLRTKEFSGDVLCSIESDPTILKAVTKIISIMVLSNQALVQEPLRNAYIDLDE